MYMCCPVLMPQIDGVLDATPELQEKKNYFMTKVFMKDYFDVLKMAPYGIQMANA